MAISTFAQCILLVFVVITFGVSEVFGGECCKAYKDLTGDLHSPQWCSDLCCINPLTFGGTYYCCDNILLQAPNKMRDSFCIQWWAAHLYVPILIGVAVLLIVAVTCCCCCCCCGCCRRQRPGYIVQNQQPVTGVAGDECCKEYTVLSGRKIDAKWCPRYCCYDTIYHDYICCEDESKRALSDHREEFCSKWWSAHLNGATITGKPHKFMTDMTTNGTIATLFSRNIIIDISE
ncbi:uncharacterized protein [Mytilus edulis]|uniref:uncharacterized protein isoform X2 n=1 Tax=Mytilus edulis TaxID=6550 RepID=UPI0039EE3EBA